MNELRGRRILVVEDEALVAMLIEDAVTEAGGAVLGPAATVSEALALLAAEAPPDAAVVDLSLGGESAKPVAEVLAERRIPFIVSTGYGENALAPSLPEVPVLAKPYEPDDLTRMLARLFAPKGR